MADQKMKEGVLFGGVTVLARVGKKQVLKKDGEEISASEVAEHRWEELIKKGHIISSKSYKEMKDNQRLHKENPVKALKEAEKMKEGIKKEQEKLKEDREALEEEKKALEEEKKALEEEKKALEKSGKNQQK